MQPSFSEVLSFSSDLLDTEASPPMQLITADLNMDTGPKKDPFLEYFDMELSDSEYSNPGYIEYTPPRPCSSTYYEDYFSEWYDSEMTECSKGSDSSSCDGSVSNSEEQSNSSGASELMQELQSLMDLNSPKDVGFTQDHGVSPTLEMLLKNGSPLSFFTFFIDENIINDMVLNTNLYASQKLRDHHKLSPDSRLPLWEPTSKSEMLKFLGILGYMRLVGLPSVQCYWSTSKLFRHKIIRRTMSRSRFRTLLDMWNFGASQNNSHEDTSCSIHTLVDNLARNCQIGYTPGETCYLHNNIQNCSKTSKEELQIFQVLAADGFTWNLKISTDANLGRIEAAMDLCQNLLYSGRTVFTDNYFTSLDLSTRLISANTHLVGTFNSTQNDIPDNVMTQIKKDQMVIQKNDHNVTLMKYPNKQNEFVLSTKDSYDLSETEIHENKIKQPKVISDYKKAKRSLAILEKNSTANTCLERSINCQTKVALDLIWNTAVLNAHCLYQKICKPIPVIKFRQEIIEELLQPYTSQKEDIYKETNKKNHTFVKEKGVSRIGRKYCRGCYKRKLKGEISKNKVRKVISFCLECDGQPRYCLPCFKECHNQ